LLPLSVYNKSTDLSRLSKKEFYMNLSITTDLWEHLAKTNKKFYNEIIIIKE
jgi:hypothetical protein